MKKQVKRTFLPVRKMLPAMAISAGVLAVILLYTSLGLAMEKNEANIVENLIIQRTEAMNSFFISEMNYREAAEKLMEVETGRLLEEDIESLRTYFRTDIDEINTYEIKTVSFTQRSEDMLCADVEMVWDVNGLEGQETVSTWYSVICEKDGETFKLVQFF